MPTDPITSDLEAFRTRLRESNDLDVYEAIERLVQSAEEIGIDIQSLIRMLDRGMTFSDLLAFLESQLECSQRAA